MMNFVWGGLLIVSFIFAFLYGTIEQVSTAAMSECTKAVTLVITLCGTICLWNGLMAIAEKAGVTAFLSRILSPVFRLIFPKLDPKGKSAKAISMNVAANLLGLGNAATPFGITAMQELEKEDRTNGVASNNMIMFVILNTSSLQLIPTTLAAMRLKAGSTAPMEILPSIVICSIVSVSCGLIAAKAWTIKKKNRNDTSNDS